MARKTATITCSVDLLPEDGRVPLEPISHFVRRIAVRSGRTPSNRMKVTVDMVINTMYQYRIAKLEITQPCRLGAFVEFIVREERQIREAERVSVNESFGRSPGALFRT